MDELDLIVQYGRLIELNKLFMQLAVAMSLSRMDCLSLSTMLISANIYMVDDVCRNAILRLNEIFELSSFNCKV